MKRLSCLVFTFGIVVALSVLVVNSTLAQFPDPKDEAKLYELAKKALLRPLNKHHREKEVAQLEMELLKLDSTKELIIEAELKELSKFRAIYFGAIGDERVKPGILEKGILLSLRFHFDQYVNLRPVKLLPGVWTPLAGKGPADVDFVVVRENTEDFYVGIGSRFRKEEEKALEVVRSLYQVKFGVDAESDAEEVAYQIGVITREGARRVIRFAFEQARLRARGSPKVTSCQRSKVFSMRFILKVMPLGPRSSMARGQGRCPPAVPW
jgi:isocitrate/isopropylmalate dehydrogenase